MDRQGRASGPISTLTRTHPRTRAERSSPEAPEAPDDRDDRDDPIPRTDPLWTHVAELQHALQSAPLPLDLEGAPAARDDRAAVLEQLGDYVLPALASTRRTPLVVVGGPTGVGKSTLVNSLLGEPVTRPGSLRPTTRSPVLAHHPADRSWSGGDQVLGSFGRVTTAADDPRTIQVVASTAVPPGIAIMDAPDFDSVAGDNRETAARLIAAADVWVFVTSAARYADQLPWQHFERALERDLTVVVVMNRIPQADLPRVSNHLRRRLDKQGFPPDRAFFVANGPVDEDGALPTAQVADLRQFLASLGHDGPSGSAVVRQSLEGAVRRASVVAGEVADAAVAQVAALAELAAHSESAYALAARDLRDRLCDGSLLTGQLAAQLQDFAGSSPKGTVAETFGTVRRRVLTGGPEVASQVRRLQLALSLAVEGQLVGTAERAAQTAGEALRGSVHGDALLTWNTEDLTRPGRALRAQAPRVVGEWQRELATALRQELLSSDLDEGLDDAAIQGLTLALGGHVVSTPGLLDARAAATDRHGLQGLLVTGAESLARIVQEMLDSERERYLPPPEHRLDPAAAARLRQAGVTVRQTLDQRNDGSR